MISSAWETCVKTIGCLGRRTFDFQRAKCDASEIRNDQENGVKGGTMCNCD